VPLVTVTAPTVSLKLLMSRLPPLTVTPYHPLLFTVVMTPAADLARISILHSRMIRHRLTIIFFQQVRIIFQLRMSETQSPQ
jgi:hypothetical protein